MNTICVIGMGTMGSQIGIVCARAGFKTLMVDVTDERVKKGMQSIHSFLKGQEKKGKISLESADQVLSFIKEGTDMAAASGADLVIEAVYEDMETKKEVFRKLDQAAWAERQEGESTITGSDPACRSVFWCQSSPSFKPLTGLRHVAPGHCPPKRLSLL